ncbi:ATP-binding protein [Streptomyces fulvorobeus]|uniref:Anti-sigma regulatory factor (Ser/Thr protein kinase) n=1 Tax=Streptomyces fulvorobeus TaxID=284028 RepID=A0A7J0C000_9ACTN|nr:ATP-binding protein [Streptomyces fulvorobeus]NYE39146.1 anti-sigma regulatory factor (Ser/Thr protein kinase) [Streptomyces fulvorobeus]GFM95347.1 hypothetical protein Sfulv_01580 [Streptomyces fulvorobeus]
MKVIVPVCPVLPAARGGAESPADAAAGARAVIGRQLARWGLRHLADDALLVMTELLTNAVRHGRPPWRVSVWLTLQEGGRRSVRLEVSDAGPGIDVELVRARWRHPSGSLTCGGRGLFIVDVLASSWGDDRDDCGVRGHTMWAELDAEPRLSGRQAVAG